MLLLLSGNAYAQDWSFQVEPYVLASGIEGDTSINRATGLAVNVDFSDILEVLDIGAMGHFETHHSSGWGAILDYGFVDLSDDVAGPRGGVVQREGTPRRPNTPRGFDDGIGDTENAASYECRPSASLRPR